MPFVSALGRLFAVSLAWLLSSVFVERLAEHAAAPYLGCTKFFEMGARPGVPRSYKHGMSYSVREDCGVDREWVQFLMDAGMVFYDAEPDIVGGAADSGAGADVFRQKKRRRILLAVHNVASLVVAMAAWMIMRFLGRCARERRLSWLAGGGVLFCNNDDS